MEEKYSVRVIVRDWTGKLLELVEFNEWSEWVMEMFYYFGSTYPSCKIHVESITDENRDYFATQDAEYLRVYGEKK